MEANQALERRCACQVGSQRPRWPPGRRYCWAGGRRATTHRERCTFPLKIQEDEETEDVVLERLSARRVLRRAEECVFFPVWSAFPMLGGSCWSGETLLRYSRMLATRRRIAVMGLPDYLGVSHRSYMTAGRSSTSKMHRRHRLCIRMAAH